MLSAFDFGYISMSFDYDRHKFSKDLEQLTCSIDQAQEALIKNALDDYSMTIGGESYFGVDAAIEMENMLQGYLRCLEGKESNHRFDQLDKHQRDEYIHLVRKVQLDLINLWREIAKSDHYKQK